MVMMGKSKSIFDLINMTNEASQATTSREASLAPAETPKAKRQLSKYGQRLRFESLSRQKGPSCTGIQGNLVHQARVHWDRRLLS